MAGPGLEIHKIVSSWPDPGGKITNLLTVGRTPPPTVKQQLDITLQKKITKGPKIRGKRPKRPPFSLLRDLLKSMVAQPEAEKPSW